LGERKKLIDGAAVAEGDVVLGLASSGLHSNGFSLVRKVLESSGLGLGDVFPDLDMPTADVLLTPTRIYVRSIVGLLKRGVPVKGMAHITGGGIAGNLSRVIPEGLVARLDRGAWTVPPVFRTLQRLGGIADDQMFLTFNMGVGYTIVVAAEAAEEAAGLLSETGERVIRLGEIVPGEAPGDIRVLLEGKV
jgi:phosphoribosylformylglycinamidine cyclo-ligase